MTTVTPGVSNQSPGLAMLDLLTNPDETKRQIADFEARKQAAEQAEQSLTEVRRSLAEREQAVRAAEQAQAAREADLTRLAAIVEAGKTDIAAREAALRSEMAAREDAVKTREQAAALVDQDLTSRKNAVEAMEASLAPQAQALADAQETFRQAQADVEAKVAETKRIWGG